MIYTTELYRKRIDNIEYASRAVKSCFRKLHIRDYIPGQAIYNLGEYLNKMTIRPTEYDYNRIKQLAENGVGLIQIHEEWNDALRVMGVDKYSSHDKEGLKEFIKLCHSFGIKILPYLSSGFFDERDPDYNPKFVAHPDAKLFRITIAIGSAMPVRRNGTNSCLTTCGACSTNTNLTAFSTIWAMTASTTREIRMLICACPISAKPVSTRCSRSFGKTA